MTIMVPIICGRLVKALDEGGGEKIQADTSTSNLQARLLGRDG